MTDLASDFDRMADRIRAISPDDFNGALVLVAPDGTAMTLMLQGSRDEAIFWATAKSKVEIAATEFAQRFTEPAFGTYGRR